MSGKLFVASLKGAGKALIAATPKYESLLETLVECANIARRDGLLSLEATVSEIEDPLLRRGLELAIDGTDPGDLTRILEAELHSETIYGGRQAKLFTDMGGYAPHHWHYRHDSRSGHRPWQPCQPGGTRWVNCCGVRRSNVGLLSANVFWLPIASKMKLLNDLRTTQGEVIIEGILAIQAGANPRMVERRLRALLPADILQDLEKAG